MAQNTTQPSNPDQQVTVVDTNNFYKALEHFDDDGHIIDDDTRFSIPCNICLERNLSLVNSRFDKRSRETHESYAVLPCGHGFGYMCLSRWIIGDINVRNPTCPTCRATVFQFHGYPQVLELWGDSSIEEQHLDIVEIMLNLRVSAIDRDMAGFLEQLDELVNAAANPLVDRDFP